MFYTIGLSSAAIAGIVVAAVIGALVIIGAVAFLLFTMGTGTAAAGAGAAAVGAPAGAFGANASQQQALQLGNYGYPSNQGIGLQNYSFNGVSFVNTVLL